AGRELTLVTEQRCIDLIAHSLSGLFFFFQAEDGIRDLIVTGVQTCALPISARFRMDQGTEVGELARRQAGPGELIHFPRDQIERSEERRVGKECRSRWWR